MSGGYEDEVSRDFALGGRPELILLDAKAWQAVGKTRAWPEGHLVNTTTNLWGLIPEWQFTWMTFIDSLADGKNIDEALQAIT